MALGERAQRLWDLEERLWDLEEMRRRLVPSAAGAFTTVFPAWRAFKQPGRSPAPTLLHPAFRPEWIPAFPPIGCPAAGGV